MEKSYMSGDEVHLYEIYRRMYGDKRIAMGLTLLALGKIDELVKKAKQREDAKKPFVAST